MLMEFKKFIEESSTEPSFNKLESVKGMMNNLDSTHMFIMEPPVVRTGEGKGYLKYKGMTDEGEETISGELEEALTSIPEVLDLPFERCYISLPWGTSLHYGEYNSEIHMSSCGFYIYEESPKYWRIIQKITVEPEEGKNYPFFISYSIIDGKIGIGNSPSADEQEFYEICVSYLGMTQLNLALEQLHKHWTVVSNDTQVKVRAKINGKVTKYKYKPSDLIYISTEKEFKTKYPSLISRVISKPKYSFEVMGHWRKLDNIKTIGKDRNGVRGVKGYTWVIPHVRGEGDIMKKIRIVK